MVVKRLPVLHHRGDFYAFGIIEPILVTFKIGYQLNYALSDGGGGGGGRGEAGGAYTLAIYIIVYEET